MEIEIYIFIKGYDVVGIFLVVLLVATLRMTMFCGAQVMLLRCSDVRTWSNSSFLSFY